MTYPITRTSTNSWLSTDCYDETPAREAVPISGRADHAFSSAFAPSVWAPPIQVFSSENDDEAEIVALPDGRFLAISSNNSMSQLRGQLFSADGSKIKGEFVIKDVTIWTHSNIKAEVLSDGRVVIVWEERTGSTAFRIGGKVIDPDEQGTGEEFIVRASEGGQYLSPSVVALADGGFVVSYRIGLSDTSDRTIVVQAFDKDQKPVGQQVKASETSVDQVEPKVIALSNGNYVLLHVDETIRTNTNVQGRIFTPDGQVAPGTAVFDVPSAATAGGNQFGIEAAALKDGRFVVVWHQVESSTGDGSNSCIFAQVFNADGSRSGAQIRVNTTTLGYQTSPVVTATADGGFAVAFVDYSAGGAGKFEKPHVRLITFDNDGEAGSDDILVNPASPLGTDPNLATLADGRIVVSWNGDWAWAAIFDPRSSGVNLNGTAKDDRYFGSNFADVLSGGKGDDWLWGGDGADEFIGGEGTDWVWYDDYQAPQNSRHGLTLSLMDSSKNTGIAAGDTYQGIEVLSGTKYDDKLEAGHGGDSLYGRFGNDLLVGGNGNDFLDAGQDNDTVQGGAGTDELKGHTGNDVLDGGNSADRMDGGEGNDTYVVDSAFDVVIDTSGTDTVLASVSYTLGTGIEVLSATGSGSITLTGNAFANTLTGNAGNNALHGLAGNDVLNGGTGSDEMYGGTGSDEMYGGAGNDIFYVDDAADQVIEAAGGGFDTAVTSISYRLGGEVEHLTATGTAHLTLTGNAFDNTLTGNAGFNKLHGGIGNDLLSGGAGKDVFVFDMRTNKRTNVDKIGDFRYQDDSLWLENKYFTKLGAGTASKPKKFSADMFVQNTKAQDAEDRIIYDKRSGKLYYDEDGTGAKAQIHIATLTNKATLKYSDLFVI